MSRRKRDGLDDEAGEAMKKEDSDEGRLGRGGVTRTVGRT